MKKQRKLVKEGLNKKLKDAVLVHFDGLKEKQQKKLGKYLEHKLDNITGYYVDLLNKETIATKVAAVTISESTVLQ